MKIRLGFVSNSSSASFVCDFCGEKRYYDSDGDFGDPDDSMCKCKNDHIMCKEHTNVPKGYHPEKWTKVPSAFCPLCLGGFPKLLDHLCKKYNINLTKEISEMNNNEE